MESNVAGVTVNVKAVNDVPVIHGRVFQIQEDQSLTMTLEGSDKENHDLTYRLVSNARLGEAKIVSDTLYYTPYPNLYGVEELKYVASDGVTESSAAVIVINITAKNDAPEAKDLLITTAEDQPADFHLEAEDIDGDSLTYHIRSYPKNGTITIDAGGAVTYTPGSYFNGTDSFTYIASDSKENSQAAQVKIIVTAVNNPPKAFAQTVSTYENKEVNITLEAFDVENDPLTFHFEQPSHGSIVANGANLVYTPDANFTSKDSFLYWVNDTKADSQKESITINILKTPNTKPVADDKFVILNEDENKTILLSATDKEQSVLTYTIKSQPKKGNLTITGDSVEYMPFKNFNGTDFFTYVANDGYADSDTAVVDITVNPVNDMPVANPQNLLTDEDSNISLSLSGYDVDGVIKEYIVTSRPLNGILNCSGALCTYLPNENYFGSDVFEFIVSDGNLSSKPAKINITVTPKNDVPVAYDKTVEVNEDENVSFYLDASDVENDIQSFFIVTEPSNGTVLLDSNSVVYTPKPDFNGNDSFTFRVRDSFSESLDATVNIVVKPVNDKPIASNYTFSLDEDSSVDINLSAVDVDDTNLVYKIVNQPMHGILDANAPNMRYIPDSDYFGEDSFSYVASDLKTDSNEATVTLTINAVNDAPIANAGEDITITQGSLVVLNAQNSTDIDDTTLSYEWKEGSILLGNDMVLQKSDFSVGVHEITLSVSDDAGAKSSDTVTVTVNPPTVLPYIPHTVTTFAIDAKWVEIDDLDNDQDRDIVSVSAANVAWYENLGGFEFKEHNISDIKTANFVKIADMNDDGFKDIIFSSSTNGYALNICTNDGNKTFDCQPVSTTVTDISSFAVADMDGDNDIDIVTASFANGGIDWIKNVGDSVFNGPYAIDDVNIENAVFVDVSDFDKDGDIDVLGASALGDNIYWYENIDSATTFTAHFQDNSIRAIGSVVATDINLDGYDDILSVSKENGAIYRHKSLGSQTPSVTFSIPIAITSSLTGVLYASGVDMDGDGDIDVLSNSSQNGGKIVWYDNNATGDGFLERLVATDVSNVLKVFGADMDNDANTDVVSIDIAGNIIVYENNSSSFALPKTGDKVSLYGEDDGKLQKGVDYIYKRDDANEIVYDTTSGLVWEDDLNVKTKTYRWSDGDSYCSGLTLGGFNDWRLPNIHELYFLLDRSAEAPMIKKGFVNTASDGYWTSVQTRAILLTYALWVGFNDARSEKDFLINEKYVRCVRGDEFVLSLTRDATKEIVNDFEHKLQWQDNNEVESNSLQWTAALDYCRSLSLDGGGWRAPNVNELHSLTIKAGWNDAFSFGSSSLYWSSTGSGGVTTVDFGKGYDNGKTQTDTANIRCVRDM